MQGTIKVGLRFRRSAARTLRNYEARVRNGELVGDVATYEQAALATEKGEPLIVVCTDVAEAHKMAALYAMHGIAMPTVEPVRG